MPNSGPLQRVKEQFTNSSKEVWLQICAENVRCRSLVGACPSPTYPYP